MRLKKAGKDKRDEDAKPPVHPRSASHRKASKTKAKAWTPPALPPGPPKKGWVIGPTDDITQKSVARTYREAHCLPAV